MHPVSPTHILLVEPDASARATLHAVVSTFAHVESHGQFKTARDRLGRAQLDFLVTNIRLNAYNGLHLVYLLTNSPAAPRAIVYSDEYDPGLAREAQRAGAFYERGRRLPVTLRAFVTGVLPAHDRREAAIPDRRGLFRGGRRCWDHHLGSQPR